MLSQALSVIIEHGISSSGHGREVVDVLNATGKSFLFQLMSTVQLPGAKGYGTHMVMHTGTRTSYTSFASEFQKQLFTAALKHGVIDQWK